jgi:hypothetical protein
MKKITYITLLYKTGASTDSKLVPLSGEFTESLFDRANKALQEGDMDMMFVPCELGLDNPADKVISEFGYDDDVDFAGVYIEELFYADFDFDDFKSRIETSENQSVEPKYTVEGFVEALEGAMYSEEVETNRLKSLG